MNLILGDCEVTDAGCQVMADIVKVNDTIEELDLPKNTKSSKKYKITTDESAEEVEKAKTTINIVYYHDEVTHPDEAHEEYALHSYLVGKGASEMKHIQKDFSRSRRTFLGNSPPTTTLQLLARETMKIMQSHQS